MLDRKFLTAAGAGLALAAVVATVDCSDKEVGPQMPTANLPIKDTGIKRVAIDMGPARTPSSEKTANIEEVGRGDLGSWEQVKDKVRAKVELAYDIIGDSEFGDSNVVCSEGHDGGEFIVRGVKKQGTMGVAQNLDFDNSSLTWELLTPAGNGPESPTSSTLISADLSKTCGVEGGGVQVTVTMKESVLDLEAEDFSRVLSSSSSTFCIPSGGYSGYEMVEGVDDIYSRLFDQVGWNFNETEMELCVPPIEHKKLDDPREYALAEIRGELDVIMEFEGQDGFGGLTYDELMAQKLMERGFGPIGYSDGFEETARAAGFELDKNKVFLTEEDRDEWELHALELFARAEALMEEIDAAREEDEGF